MVVVTAVAEIAESGPASKGVETTHFAVRQMVTLVQQRIDDKAAGHLPLAFGINRVQQQEDWDQDGRDDDDRDDDGRDKEHKPLDQPGRSDLYWQDKPPGPDVRFCAPPGKSTLRHKMV